jgi:hypothetical protein
MEESMQKKVVLALVLLVAVLGARCGLCQEKPPSASTTKAVSKAVIPKEWLQFKTTIEVTESNNTFASRQPGPKPVPFGANNAAWEKFKAGMRPGDELWSFEAPPDYPDGKLIGYGLVRGGQVVDSFIKDAIPKEWLMQKTTVEKAEQDNLGTRMGSKPVPYRFNAQWEKFKAGMRPGDELWTYKFSGGKLAGQGGYCILRGGRIIDKYITYKK